MIIEERSADNKITGKINADYHGLRGAVIRKEPDKPLMKMFNLINIGERAGKRCAEYF